MYVRSVVRMSAYNERSVVLVNVANNSCVMLRRTATFQQVMPTEIEDTRVTSGVKAKTKAKKLALRPKPRRNA